MKTTTMQHAKSGKKLTVFLSGGHGYADWEGEEYVEWLGGGSRGARDLIARALGRGGYVLVQEGGK